MPRILFVSNTANFSKFNRPYMQDLRAKGWIVDYASPCEEEVLDCDNSYKISIKRNPLHLGNVRAISEMKKLISKNHYDIIHCHTPMGGAIARLAAKRLWKKGKIKVIYTAHGFHFYKGAPLLNWLVYYPIEKYLSKFTDVLITINKEDYQIAKEKFRAKEIIKMDGVGVNLEKFMPVENWREKNE